MWDKTDYIIKITFNLLFGLYFLATENYLSGVTLITLMMLNIKWFIRDLKE